VAIKRYTQKHINPGGDKGYKRF